MKAPSPFARLCTTRTVELLCTRICAGTAAPAESASHQPSHLEQLSSRALWVFPEEWLHSASVAGGGASQCAPQQRSLELTTWRTSLAAFPRTSLADRNSHSTPRAESDGLAAYAGAAPLTVQAWGPVRGTRTASERSQASELYSTSPKPAPRAEDATEAAHTEMFNSVQCSSFALRRAGFAASKRVSQPHEPDARPVRQMVKRR